MDNAVSFGSLNSGVQTGINHGTINASLNLSTDPLDKLYIAHGAEFNSYGDQHEDDCLPGTRIELLETIQQWVRSPHGKCIFWLNGMAGTGKSTISRTVAKSFRQKQLVIACFFFKRGEGDRGNAKKFFSTITRQLAAGIPDLTPSIRKAIHSDPDLATKSLSEQFDKLIIQPFQSLQNLTLPIPVVAIVIDALDECETDNDIRVIVQLLPQVQKIKAVQFRIFLTSRPELPIRLGFLKIAKHEYRDLALHEIPEAVTAHDITLFLKDRLNRIRDTKDVPVDWPRDEEIQSLVAMSVPLFISAATVCRLVEVKLDPVESLTDLLRDQANYATTMDKTYLPVLTQFLNGRDDDYTEQLLQSFQQIVGLIILLAVPLSVNGLSGFLDIKARVITNLLDSFRSVLSLPRNPDLPVKILHASFRDFLVQSNGKFRVNERKKHKEIALNCLKIMRTHLKKNICNLETPCTNRTDIDPQSLRQCFPPELEYSCRYWAHHVKHGEILSSGIENVLFFLREKFLHWVEAMSLLGFMSEVMVLLDLLYVISDYQKHAISDFIHDAKRFILKNRRIVDEMPLRLYCSALIFAPRMSIIRREFETEIPTWISQLPHVNERWSAELQAFEGHSDEVRSVAFSPDGRLLVSGSDTIIRVWDVTTGTLQQTCTGHSYAVLSVSFSPNGRLLASGSDDGTLRLWDVTTGVLQQTFNHNLDQVFSVAFSPDSRLIASGSYDPIVRLWDTMTGVLQQTFKGHSDSVRSVGFSPNGRLLASGSDDESVPLWDTTLGTIQHILKGHTDWVRSVAFSPNGRLLASGSDDRTVRLWDTTTGQGTSKDDLGQVLSVTFSPGGRLLASGSHDQNVRIWDTATSVFQHTIQRHSGPVSSVAFSPDGRTLAFGSSDKIVRLWDATIGLEQSFTRFSDLVQSGQPVTPFSDDKRRAEILGGFARCMDILTGLHSPEHFPSLYSTITFSPDGRLLASTSENNIVCLWDTTTGTLQHALKGHLRRASFIASSPNDRLLASSSEDRNLQLRDTTTGALKQTFESYFDPNSLVVFSSNGRLLASLSSESTDTPRDLFGVETSPNNLPWLAPVDFPWLSSFRDHSLLPWRSIDDTPRPLQLEIVDIDVAFSGTSDQAGSNSAYRHDKDIVRVWDTTTGILQQIIEGRSRSILSVRFSPDDQLLVFDSSDKIIQLRDPATGAIQENESMERMDTEVELPQDKPYSSTDPESFDIPTCGIHTSHSPHLNLKIDILQKQWVTLNGEKVLWLPPEFRPHFWATNGGILALGYFPERISFLGFCR
ncbi:hypothetical protein LT330_005175 [Penicillium expansum]|nr:hypothetical protein LT330_005175 [Penicillium expansum]